MIFSLSLCLYLFYIYKGCSRFVLLRFVKRFTVNISLSLCLFYRDKVCSGCSRHCFIEWFTANISLSLLSHGNGLRDYTRI